MNNINLLGLGMPPQDTAEFADLIKNSLIGLSYLTGLQRHMDGPNNIGIE